MDNFLFFLLTLLMALIGGTIGYKLKLPAGAMVGAMLFVALFNILTEKGYFYSDLTVCLQVLSGAMIGSRMSKSDLIEMKKLIFPIVVLMIGMLMFNLVFGTLIAAVTTLDVPTALFATAPGGMTDMAILSADLGADSGTVAILQLARLLIIFTLVPPIITKICSVNGRPSSANINNQIQNSTDKDKKNYRNFYIRLALLILFSAIGAAICIALNVTAGAMIGAMVASAIYCILRGKIEYPSGLKLGIQIFAGAFIGMRFSRASVVEAGGLLLPIGIMLVGIILFVLVTSYLMHKLTKIDPATSMLACTPGGIQEMSLLSEDLCADTPKVAILQTSRLILVILLFPTMIETVIKLL